MVNERKFLKWSSIAVLIFAVLTLIKIITELVLGDFGTMQIPKEAVTITKIILFVVSTVFLVLQTYVGIRGLLEAKNPTSATGHITVAKVLFVISVLGLISPLISIFQQAQQGTVGDPFQTLFSVLFDVIVFYDFIKYATAVAKNN